MVPADPAMERCDRILVEVAHELRLFHHVNPTNEQAEKERFLGDPSVRGEPRYTYPELSFSPADLEARLVDLPLTRLASSQLRDLLEAKRVELLQLIGLLRARSTPGFLRRSLALFGRPPAALVTGAERLLGRPRRPERPTLATDQIRERYLEYLGVYQERYPDFRFEVVLAESSSSNVFVTERRIHLKQGLRLSEAAVTCDLHHEVDAHILTHLNGLSQPLGVFAAGLAGFVPFQESLGIFTEIATGACFPERVMHLAARILAVDRLVEGASFADVFLELHDRRVDPDAAYAICQRVFRSGGFTKDWTYVAELEPLFRYWAAGNDLGLLLLGKVTLAQLDAIAGLLADGFLRPARYLPPYLRRIAPARDSPEVHRLLQTPCIPLEALFDLRLDEVGREG